MTAAIPSVRPVLILHTGDPDDTLKSQFGGYAEQLARASGLAPDALDIVAVHNGERPGAPGRYRAALITGSPAMVTDLEPWSEDTAAWLREAAAAGLPMFGICYGHQLLAHALGGKVGYNPAGREVGTQTVELLPAAAGDKLRPACPPRSPPRCCMPRPCCSRRPALPCWPAPIWTNTR
jgi:GMP synthase (glutamine-hydrolysing)